MTVLSRAVVFFAAVAGVQHFLLGEAVVIGEPFGVDRVRAQFNETLLEAFRLGDAAQGASMARESAVVRIPPSGIPLEDVERQALTEALKMANWVQKDAADLLSISPRVMNYKIKTLKIELPKRRVVALAG